MTLPRPALPIPTHLPLIPLIPAASGEELPSPQLSVLGNILSVAVRELGASRPLG